MGALWEKIETWFFVSVITVLVWVYADAENVKPRDLDVTIRPVAASGQDLMISAVTHSNVRLTVRCSQSQLAKLKNMARNPIDLPVQADPNARTQTLDVREKLTVLPMFSDLGATITEADPPKVSVDVEVVETLTMDVRIVSPEGVQLAPGATVDPSRVKVRVPRRDAKLLEGLNLEAHLTPDNIAGLDENVQQEIQVAVQLPDIVGVPLSRLMIDQPTVDVTFAIRKQTDSHVVSSVPIHISASPVGLRGYNIVPDQLFVSDVKVVGTSDVIRKIRDGELRLIAELRLSSDDLEKRIESAVPYIDLPAGVTLGSQVPRINLKITPRLEAPLTTP